MSVINHQSVVAHRPVANHWSPVGRSPVAVVRRPVASCCRPSAGRQLLLYVPVSGCCCPFQSPVAVVRWPVASSNTPEEIAFRLPWCHYQDCVIDQLDNASAASHSLMFMLCLQHLMLVVYHRVHRQGILQITVNWKKLALVRKIQPY